MKFLFKACCMTVLAGASFLFARGRLPLLLPGNIVQIMKTGGDERIIIPEGQHANKYYTSPLPDDGTIMRSSATSCNSSVQGFLAARQLYDFLRIAQNAGRAENCFQHAMNKIRDRMKLYWGASVEELSYVVTTPSGTDAEMLPALAALVRNSSWKVGLRPEKPLVTNIVVANGEVGTGTMLAAGMKHFSSITPIGKTVMVGNCIEGIADGTIEAIGIPFRDEQGRVVSMNELEGRIKSLLYRSINENNQIAVLHVMHVSKTGLSGPSPEFVSAMKKEYGDKLIVVVDAAHLRMDPEAAAKWLDAGYWIMITGSKFLGGASFSGALLIPAYDAVLFAQAERNKIPVGLGDYISPSDCDDIFTNLRAVLPPWYNVGLALRWKTALTEAERFYAIEPSHRDRGLAAWAAGVRTIVRSSDCLQLLDDLDERSVSRSWQELVGKTNTVISFAVTTQAEDGSRRFMNTAELRRIHELLTLDLRKMLPNLTDKENFVAMTKCLIGQPVQIATTGSPQAIIRIAIAAPEIYKAIAQERLDPALLIDTLLAEDELIVRKLEMILAHWDYFSELKKS
jgi:hypothetical protein